MSNRGRTFLTDPWFSQRPRYPTASRPRSGVSELSALDGMLISHHHYDHCDLKAVRAYRDRSAPMLVAARVAAGARRPGFTNDTPLAHGTARIRAPSSPSGADLVGTFGRWG